MTRIISYFPIEIPNTPITAAIGCTIAVGLMVLFTFGTMVYTVS